VLKDHLFLLSSPTTPDFLFERQHERFCPFRPFGCQIFGLNRIAAKTIDAHPLHSRETYLAGRLLVARRSGVLVPSWPVGAAVCEPGAV
jgi:hypothetical protein